MWKWRRGKDAVDDDPDGFPDDWVPTEADKQQALEDLRHTWETTQEDRRGRIFESVIADNKEIVVRYWQGTGLNREAAETATALEIASIPKNPSP